MQTPSNCKVARSVKNKGLNSLIVDLKKNDYHQVTSVF